ncbi:MAG: hypothetical protein QM754_02185 [Tepidisphaeraceae bacterium]
MNEPEDKTPTTKLTKRQLQNAMSKRMGQKTVDEQVLDFRCTFFINMAKKQDSGVDATRRNDTDIKSNQ